MSVPKPDRAGTNAPASALTPVLDAESARLAGRAERGDFETHERSTERLQARIAETEARTAALAAALRRRDEQVGRLTNRLAIALGEAATLGERLTRAEAAAVRERERQARLLAGALDGAARERLALEARVAASTSRWREREKALDEALLQARAAFDRERRDWDTERVAWQSRAQALAQQLAQAQDDAGAAREAAAGFAAAQASAIEAARRQHEQVLRERLLAQQEQNQRLAASLQARLEAAIHEADTLRTRLAERRLAAPPPAPVQHPAVQGSETAADAGLDRLMSLYDEAFVDTCYHLLLGREPDPVGRDAYLAHVRGGVSREAIVAAIASSPEGRNRIRAVPGLAELCDRVARARPALPARLWRRFLRAVGGDASLALGALENTLGPRLQALLERQAATTAQLSCIEQELAESRAGLAQLEAQVCAAELERCERDARLQASIEASRPGHAAPPAAPPAADETAGPWSAATIARARQLLQRGGTR